MVKPLLTYLAGLQVSQGVNTGQRFTVLPWQRLFIRKAFRSEDGGSFAVSVGKGNGKTTLCAGIAAAAVFGPLVRPRGEVVIVASSFPQARISFEHLREFLSPAIQAEPARWKIWDSSNNAMIEDRTTGARARCLGSDPRRAHGIAPAMLLLDEGAQWPPSTSDQMFSALETSLGKIPGSLLIALGTRPSDPEHWFAKLLDSPGGVAYAALKDDPIFQVRTWRKANPSLKHMPGFGARNPEGSIQGEAGPVNVARLRSTEVEQRYV